MEEEEEEVEALILRLRVSAVNVTQEMRIVKTLMVRHDGRAEQRIVT
jgi:hypothetical protein